MQRKLWSLSSLAVELQRNPRTIAAAMDGVKPDGVVGPKSTSAWFMSTAFSAMTAHAAGTGRARNRTGIGEERVRLTKEQADKIAFANSVARSEYWKTEEALRIYHEGMARLRACMTAVPDRVAARCGHLKSARH